MKIYWVVILFAVALAVAPGLHAQDPWADRVQPVAMPQVTFQPARGTITVTP